MTKWTAAALDAPHTQRHLDEIPQTKASRPKPITMSKPSCPQCDTIGRGHRVLSDLGRGCSNDQL